jgi:serine/threonine-protein kinase
MSGRVLALSLVLAAIAFCVGDLSIRYSELPPQVASHFNAAGAPDGWSSKEQFLVLSLVTFGIVCVTFAAAMLTTHFGPAALVNLPNKQYWFAPERERKTRQALIDWTMWFMAATVWQLALIFHDAIDANLRQPPRLEMAWWLIGGYAAVVVILLAQLIARFRRGQ